MQFILNDKEVETSLPSGMLLLDFIRYQKHLMGTKIGCREGDCGACTVLIGEPTIDGINYKSATSCLTALGNIVGKHVVTIEGLNLAKPNLIQQAMCDEGASQCGFCTPGFVVSLAGFCLAKQSPTYENAIAAIDGNICRCTGYKSIERAAATVATAMQDKPSDSPLAFLIEKNVLPGYFATISAKLQHLSEEHAIVTNFTDHQTHPSTNGIAFTKKILGGGTDLYVQQPDAMEHATVDFLFNKKDMHLVKHEGSRCTIGGAATVTDLLASPAMHRYFPELKRFAKLVSSTPIRNIATIAGNFINASPIGDFTIFFLALNAYIELSNGETKRQLALRQLYKGYKKLDKQPDEYITSIWFDWPDGDTRFHFEKVSKRTNLDIASVNTAVQFVMDGDRIMQASLSAGGVGPIPAFLANTSAFLQGKRLNEDLVKSAIETAQVEISPISDARGTAVYKRLLLGQLIKAHFITLFPTLFQDLE